MQIDDTNSHFAHTHHIPHSFTHTHIHTFRHSDECKAQTGDTFNPGQLKGGLPMEELSASLGTPPIDSYYVTVLSRYLCSRWQMQFVVCTRELLHCKLAIGNGWRALGDGQRAMAIAQLAAKNGCKDMIISNHLNNLLQAAARVRVHRAQWKY